MKPAIKVLLMLFVIGFSVITETNRYPAKSISLAGEAKRIRFQINTIEERREHQKIISSALVEGAPGTDFDIDLNGERFKMSAKFLTDVDDQQGLKIRADLKTRRLYGMSERNLPLYEEDEQRQALQIGFDEQVILLPFGRGGDERLRIEITPMMTDEPIYLANGKLRPLEIKMPVVSPGGIISIQARKIPHHFDVDILLLEDGQEIARAGGQFLLREKREVLLQPSGQTGAGTFTPPIAVNLSIEDCIQARPVDDAVINFDVHRLDDAGKRTTIGLNWSGVTQVGNGVSYQLPEGLSKSGKPYELKLNVRIAQGAIVE